MQQTCMKFTWIQRKHAFITKCFYSFEYLFHERKLLDAETSGKGGGGQENQLNSPDNCQCEHTPRILGHMRLLNSRAQQM
jgi:hypothetical protein